MARSWRLIAAGLIGILSAASAHAADHSRFLPKEPGFPAGSYKWNNVGGPNGTEFNADVLQGADKVGEFRFSYDTYIDNVTPQPIDGGAALAGGFAAAQGFMLKPDFGLSFVQTVIATKAGNNEWMAPNGTEFPDSLDPQGLRPARSTPLYINTSLTPDLMGGGRGLSPQFNDFPGRVFADGDQFWRAELGLVAVNFMTKEIRVIANILWGFDVAVGPPRAIAPRTPIALGAPTMQYMDTLTKYFDNVADNQPGKPSTMVWTFTRTDAFMRIPEPHTLWLGMASGGALLTCVTRRRGAIRQPPKRAAA